MKIYDIDQGSVDWDSWRREGIGASEAAAIIGVSPWTTRQDILLAKTRPAAKPQEKTEAMLRGLRLEPLLRKIVSEATGLDFRPVCVEHDEISWLRASLDGLSSDGLCTIEIKCPNSITHAVALNGQIPDKYYPQLQHILLVTGHTQMKYISYSESWKFSRNQQLVVVHCKKDESFQKWLLEEERAFWKQVCEIRKNLS